MCSPAHRVFHVPLFQDCAEYVSANWLLAGMDGGADVVVGVVCHRLPVGVLVGFHVIYQIRPVGASPAGRVVPVLLGAVTRTVAVSVVAGSDVEEA
jgi:hypothetical protein